jgi:hypothetical protein
MRMILVITTVFLGALLYFFIDARYTTFFPQCPFHSLTGLYCPGCGSQRAISSLLHGDILQAISFNILLVISIPFISYSAAIHCINAFTKFQMQQRIFYSPIFVKVVFVIVALFWVTRNISVYPFSLLAPHA